MTTPDRIWIDPEMMAQTVTARRLGSWRAPRVDQRDEPRPRDHRPIAALSRQRRRVIGPRLTGAVTERVMADRGRAA